METFKTLKTEIITAFENLFVRATPVVVEPTSLQVVRHVPVVDTKWLIVGVAATCGFAYLLYDRRKIASMLCDLTKTNINKNIRSEFRNLRVTSLNDSPRHVEHSHPDSARNRTNAETSIDNFILSTGCEPYSVSTSARDHHGQRLYYCAKDVDLDYRDNGITDNHILRMIDVDYYADMEAWLWHGRPIAIYTFVPEHAGGSVVEGTFSIEHDEVNVIYDGGGIYKHKLWNYNVDHFIIKGVLYSLMVKVDQIKLTDDTQRRIILLTPTTWYWSCFNWMFDKPNRLERRKYSYGLANITTYHEKNQLFVSISSVGSPSSVSIRYQTFVALCIRLRNSKHPNISDIERYLHHDKVLDAANIAPLVFAAYEGGWYDIKYKQLDTIVDCGNARPASYQALAPLVTEDGREIGQLLMDPFITGAVYFPKDSFNNDYLSVKERVIDVKNKVKPGQKYTNYANEFLKYFPTGQLDPLSLAEIIEHQKRPAQKQRNERAKHFVRTSDDNIPVAAFMKKEALPKITAPRNISSVPTSHTLELSTYTYAAKEELKKLHWFMPGKNPETIAQEVCELVQDNDEAYVCDYSRLDGTINEFLRNLEKSIYVRLFKKQYRTKLGKILSSEFKTKATTKNGVRYTPNFSRLSGSPLTTDGNTIITAFVAYCAGRNIGLLKAGEVHLIPAKVYGDDKLVVGIDDQHMEEAAKALGLTLKCETIHRHEPLTYLARVFVDPWTTTTSVQDPLRAIGKIHTSVVKDVPIEIVAKNKARGYFVTDRLTPYLREICLYIEKYTSSITDFTLEQYSEKLIRDTNFWVREHDHASWPQDKGDYDLMLRVVAHSLNVTISDLKHRIEVLRDRGIYEPIHFETLQRNDVVVDTMPGPLAAPPQQNSASTDDSVSIKTV